MHILHVVGARPNFMKVSPVYIELATRTKIQQTLVHTGQHYDVNMSDVFFQQLQIPEPDVNLGIGSGSHTAQTSQIMLEIEKVLLDRKPDMVVVYGDVNSTVASALVCAKLLIPLSHVEAGLRSNDRTMPEEINRLITDQISDLLFTPSVDGNENLVREGIPANKIHFVGNVMIDTLVRLLPQIGTPVVDSPYMLVTLHRPANVDDPAMLKTIIDTLHAISKKIPIVFPVHPRTRQRLQSFGFAFESNSRLQLIDPVGYLEFIGLQQAATVVLTDSGGIQEETTFLGIPCLTLRENTERPVTITYGTNKLVGLDMAKLIAEVDAILDGHIKRGSIPPLWDGMASKRIIDILAHYE